MTSDSFFNRSTEQWFMPTDHTRGPWSEHHCHAGPPTALIARAMESILPEQRLTRLTVALTRPIPFNLMRATASVERKGRIVSTTTAMLIDHEDYICARATGLHMTPQESTELPTVTTSIGDPNLATLGDFPIKETLHQLPAFNGDGVQTRYPAGQNAKPGPTIAWLKTVPLFCDEESTPFQRICPLADCGNAFGRNADASEVNFMNPDLTILLHRDPIGEWFGTDATGYWETSGIGMADAQLFDQRGAVGRALQTLLLRKPQ